MKAGFRLAPGIEIGYIMKNAYLWEVKLKRTAAGFAHLTHNTLTNNATFP